MSRVGKLPVLMPEGVSADIGKGIVKITGPKGNLSREFPREVTVKEEEKNLLVERKNDSKKARAMQGTLRAHLANMVLGVTEGWSKELEMVGVGYRSQVSGDKLVLTVGFSHPVEVKAPEGIKFSVEKSIIKIEGIDKEGVGQIAAKIRAVRPPEPYKGKGIRYIDEVVRRKPGKQAVSAAA